MENIKQNVLKKFLAILKCCLIGLIVTLLGVVVFALILKFADLPSKAIGYINDIIKALSIFVIVFLLNKKMDGKLIINSIFAGIIYAVLALAVFSILNGAFNINMSILYDLLFSIIVAMIVAVMINLMSRKN